jgi:glycerate dehydrogenase
MINGVVLDQASFDQGDLKLDGLRDCAVNWQWHEQTGPDTVDTRLDGVTVVITNKVVLDAATLQRATALKLVCIAATGTNNIDLAAAATLGIEVRNVSGYATASVVQHTFALILSLTTQHTAVQQALARGDWQASTQFCLLQFPIAELAGKTLGIIGYGELGRAVAGVGRSFGMRVAVGARPGTDAHNDRADLDELLQRSDIISLHCPLADNTRNLIGPREFELMKSTALLINTARGGIVDEAALLQALQQKKIGGAGFDVLADEPPRAGNVLLDAKLTNLIVTPHIAWASIESRQRLIDQVAQQVIQFIADR